MSRGLKKLAEKKVAYDDAMRQQPPSQNRKSKPRWIRHTWDQKTDSLVTKWEPGFFPRRNADWHREGSIDEIEQRENAGQRSLF